MMSSADEDVTSSIKVSLPKKRYCTDSIGLFGVDLTADNIVVAMVYFVQGILGLSRLAVSFYMKDDLHLDPAETTIISGISSLPWLVKPLYGFISDSFPLFGYRRKSYLVISGLLGAFSWSLMTTFVDSKYDVAFCILMGSLSVAFSDVVVDSMVVERARGESQSMSGSLQLLCWGSSVFGAILSSYFSGSLVAAYGVRCDQATSEREARVFAIRNWCDVVKALARSEYAFVSPTYYVGACYLFLLWTHISFYWK